MSMARIDYKNQPIETFSNKQIFTLSPITFKALRIVFDTLNPSDWQETVQVSKLWRQLSVSAATKSSQNVVKELAGLFCKMLGENGYFDESKQIYKLAHPHSHLPVNLLAVKSIALKSIGQILIPLTQVREDDLRQLQLQSQMLSEDSKMLINQVMYHEFESMKRFAILLADGLETTSQAKKNIHDFLKNRSEVFESLDFPKFRTAIIYFIKTILNELSQLGKLKKLKQHIPEKDIPSFFKNVFVLSNCYQDAQKNWLTNGTLAQGLKLLGMRVEYFK